VSEILVCTGKNVNTRHLARIVSAAQNGDIFVLPTETGYCFAGLAEHKATHAGLLKLREAHPRHKPFSLLCRDAQQISQVALLSTSAFRVLNRVLPGPFTLILPIHKNTPKMSTGEFRRTVGVRMSAHPVAQAVLDALAAPLMVTSVTDADELAHDINGAQNRQDVNHWSEESEAFEHLNAWWTHAEGILEHCHRPIPLIIAGEEPLPLRVSTILDLTEDGEVKVLRDGGWDYESF